MLTVTVDGCADGVYATKHGIKGIWYLVLGLSKVFLRHIAPERASAGGIKTSLHVWVRISRQGTPNGVMLLPPEACVFSSYMCVYFLLP
jgi:hypothetical protein